SSFVQSRACSSQRVNTGQVVDVARRQRLLCRESRLRDPDVTDFDARDVPDRLAAAAITQLAEFSNLQSAICNCICTLLFQSEMYILNSSPCDRDAEGSFILNC